MTLTDWTLFFGRFHPLFVHLPIGIILFAALLEIVAVYKKKIFLSTAINIALLTGALGAGLAAVSGYFLSTSAGYNDDVLFWHKWIGILAAVITLLAWLIRVYKKWDIPFLKIKITSWLLASCIILITIGAHLGAKMTHGDGYLTRYMPGFLQSLFAVKNQPEHKKIIPALDSVIVFADIIHPIFNSRCISCHNPGKNKGELDLTTIEGLLTGGKSGNTIVAGDLEKSELVHRITLPKESSKFMPADARPPLTAIEINFIKWWIQTGADHKKTISAAGVDEKTRYLIAVYLGIDPENDKEIKLPEITPADSATLQQLKEMKVIIRPLTAKSNLLEASLVIVQNAGPSQMLRILEKLSAVKEQLYRLDASNCMLNSEAIKIIASFTHLSKLEIQRNNLTDDVIEPLSILQELVVLNAGQNMLTDKSMAIFKKLSSLKKLNLWQTRVTEKGLTEFQSQLPGVVIDL